MTPARTTLLSLAAGLTLAGCAAHAPRAHPVVSSPEQKVVATPALRAPHPEPELVTVKHRVEKGQTMYRIARTYGVTVEELAAINQIADPTGLAVGQELVIPGAGRPVDVPATARPAHGEGVAASQNVQAPRAPETAPPTQPASESTARLSWPLRGVLYARFGKKGREAHDGIDLAAPEGTPVVTAAPGKVLFAGEQRGYGLLAIVEHQSGLVTLYAHNRDLRVRTGQTVRTGQVIATVGQSGRTSGPHLHFEVRREGMPVDPLGHLPSPTANLQGRSRSTR